jgi:tryptophan synthase alpha chain
VLGRSTAGADVLEVGVPFSDPLADGPVIQRATERALAAGATLGGVLDLVADLRADVRAPVVLFSYANPIARMGFDAFARAAAGAGVDGVLVLDLPIEEAERLPQPCWRTRDLLQFSCSARRPRRRIRQAAALGRGFLYGISRLGVTGARDTVASGARLLARRVRRKPRCRWRSASGSRVPSTFERSGCSPMPPSSAARS